MTIERALRLIGGGFVALSVVLGYLVNPWFFAFTAFVGFNLFQSGITGFCPPGILLRKLGVKEAGSCGTGNGGSCC